MVPVIGECGVMFFGCINDLELFDEVCVRVLRAFDQAFKARLGFGRKQVEGDRAEEV